LSLSWLLYFNLQQLPATNTTTATMVAMTKLTCDVKAVADAPPVNLAVVALWLLREFNFPWEFGTRFLVCDEENLGRSALNQKYTYHTYANIPLFQKKYPLKLRRQAVQRPAPIRVHMSTRRTHRNE
jgi:hypothetical protein